MNTYSIAVVGATGLVGSTLLALLEERNFPLKNLYLVASQQSMGKEIKFKGEHYPIHDLGAFDFHQSHISFFVRATILLKSMHT